MFKKFFNWIKDSVYEHFIPVAMSPIKRGIHLVIEIAISAGVKWLNRNGYVTGLIYDCLRAVNKVKCEQYIFDD